ncbi:MAG: hypothetical protein ACTSPY_18400 [Candidatus Helarchaeota archaeon]
MSNYDKEKSQLKTIANHLNKMNIPFDYVDLKFGENVRPIIVFNKNYGNIYFDVVVVAQSHESVDDWLTVRCLLYDFSELKINQINSIFKLCLELNYYIPETTFSVNNNLIFIENDMPLDISHENFEFEILGFDVGIQNFISGMENLGFEVKGIQGLYK